MDHNLIDIHNELKKAETNPASLDKLGNSIFKRNMLSTQFNESLTDILGFLNELEIDKFCLIKTHKWNYILLNKTITDLVDGFDGKQNLKSIFEGIKLSNLDFFVLNIGIDYYNLFEVQDISTYISKMAVTFSLEGKFENFIELIKILYRYNIIELSYYDDAYQHFAKKITNTGKINLENTRKVSLSNEYPLKNTQASSPRVVLFGDSVGTNTIGLLYLASFLRRNGIEAFCQWNDQWRNQQLLKENVTDILSKLKPDIVGVSMKWFPHIARALEICQIVKEFSAAIKVVVGGDSATYFGEEIIKYECIDYVIQGEGELPVLKLSRNETDIPNCIYKKNNEIIISPRTYVQTKENNSNIYLSHLDEIFVSPVDPYYATTFFIQPGKGCAFNCFYCAGNLETQKKNFNRAHPYLRDMEAVKTDIREAGKYTRTLLFDFELRGFDSLDYYQKLWEGIDLSDYHCYFLFWTLPSCELLKLLAKTFKYVYLSIDLCSLSEPHRMRLSEMKIVKPQPTDEELFSFLDIADGFTNIDLNLSIIGGLPYFDLADIKESDKILSGIMTKYNRFASLYWPRLYAEPGASITCESEKYQMASPAQTFGNFLNYSKLNFEAPVYPKLDALNYPHIRYQDQHLESEVSKFIAETQKKLMDFYLSLKK
jgi:hypothetical protein